MAIGWIVAISKPSREYYAAENLARQDCEFYFPKIVEHVMRGPRQSRYRVERSAPLFPRYIFVRIQHQWRFLLNTYGLAGVLMKGEEPHFASQSAIDDMRNRQDDEGMVHLPLLKEIERGDRVQITKGQFAGYHGIYQGMSSRDRTKVLLDYLGRKTPVLIARGYLRAAA